MAVSYTEAEQGQTIRIPVVVLLAGVPATPTSISIEIRDVATSSLVATLTAVSNGNVGGYYGDWDIPALQALGYYRAVFVVVGGAADSLTFEVRAAGSLTAQQTPQAELLTTVKNNISSASQPEIFMQLVRAIMRDHPQLNRLTKGREHSDGDIGAAMYQAMSLYNVTPPIMYTQVTFTTFPSIAMLVVGTVGWLLRSSLTLRHRNQLAYNDGGISLDTENIQGYEAQAAWWWQQYQQWITPYKTAKNLNDAWGSGLTPTGNHSEYLLLAGYLGGGAQGDYFR